MKIDIGLCEQSSMVKIEDQQRSVMNLETYSKDGINPFDQGFTS